MRCAGYAWALRFHIGVLYASRHVQRDDIFISQTSGTEKWVVTKWRAEAGFDGPLRSLKPFSMGIRIPQPLTNGPAEGGALEEGLRGPYAHRKHLRHRTGPSKPPEVATRKQMRPPVVTPKIGGDQRWSQPKGGCDHMWSQPKKVATTDGPKREADVSTGGTNQKAVVTTGSHNQKQVATTGGHS